MKDLTKLAQTEVKHLWASAKDAQQQVLRPDKSTTGKFQSEVWDATMTEAEQGLLIGPLSPELLAQQVGPSLWVPARRFGIQQGENVRPVDDCSEHGQFSVGISGKGGHAGCWPRGGLGQSQDQCSRRGCLVQHFRL